MEMDPALFDEYDNLDMIEAEAFRDQLPERQRLRREKVCRQRINMDFPVVEEFRARFRISVATADAIERSIGELLRHPSERNFPLTPRQQLLTALRFYATGGFYQLVGDGHGPSKATVFRAVHKVTAAICANFSAVITWPDDMDAIKEAFAEKAGMPDVLGCIDGTHVPVTVPINDRPQYINRKGFTSLNVMAVCGPDLRFYEIATHCTGRVHDARVLRTSSLPDRFRGRDRRPAARGHLLGDSAYPLTNWLLTPVTGPTTPAAEAYNRSHCRTRVVIENAFGVAKRRFPVLGSGLRIRSIRRSVRVVRACMMLHNVCVLGGDRGEWLGVEDVPPPPANDQREHQLEAPRQSAAERRAGMALRDAVIQRFA